MAKLKHIITSTGLLLLTAGFLLMPNLADSRSTLTSIRDVSLENDSRQQELSSGDIIRLLQKSIINNNYIVKDVFPEKRVEMYTEECREIIADISGGEGTVADVLKDIMDSEPAFTESCQSITVLDGDNIVTVNLVSMIFGSMRICYEARHKVLISLCITGSGSSTDSVKNSDSYEHFPAELSKCINGYYAEFGISAQDYSYERLEKNGDFFIEVHVISTESIETDIIQQ